VTRPHINVTVDLSDGAERRATWEYRLYQASPRRWVAETGPFGRAQVAASTTEAAARLRLAAWLRDAADRIEKATLVKKDSQS
jgi:hypothetical protein